MSKKADLSPTSELPFAARHCDLASLDWVKNYRSKRVERAMLESGIDDGVGVSYAYGLVAAGDRMDKIGELLVTVESLFEKARRGDTSERSPNDNFSMAISLLGLSRELLKVLGFETNDELERVCIGIADVPEPALEKRGQKVPV